METYYVQRQDTTGSRYASLFGVLVKGNFTWALDRHRGVQNRLNCSI